MYKGKFVIVVGFNFIGFGDVGYFWEVVKNCGFVEKELDIGE